MTSASYEDVIEQLEIVVRPWIEPFGDAFIPSKKVQENLRDGVTLCKMINKYIPNIVKNIHPNPRIIRQMENLNNYVESCTKIGVPNNMLFDTLEFHGNKELDKFFAHLLYMMNNIEKLANQYLNNTSVSEPPTLIQSIATTTVKPVAQRSSPISFATTTPINSTTPIAIRRGSLSAPIPSPIPPLLGPTTSLSNGPPGTPKEENPQFGKMHKCNSCSTEFPLTSRFCPQCGTVNLRASPQNFSANQTSNSPISSVISPPKSMAGIGVTSMEFDMNLKEELKSSPELERMAKVWIENVTGEKFSSPSFVFSLKSGVLLCKLINAISPGITPKINYSNIEYLQMGNIANFLKACEILGLDKGELFDTTDLFLGKNTSMIVANIHALAKISKKIPTFNGPYMETEDINKTRNLFSIALGKSQLIPTNLTNEIPIIDEKQKELIEWFNSQLVKKYPNVSIKNLSSDLSNGVRLLQLLEIVNRGSVGMYDENPKGLMESMHNATMVMNFLAAQTFEKFLQCTPKDIIQGQVDAIISLIEYIRNKFDLDYLFKQLVNKDSQDEDFEEIIEEEEYSEESLSPTPMTSSTRKTNNNNNNKGFDKDLSISPIRKLTKPKSLSSSLDSSIESPIMPSSPQASFTPIIPIKSKQNEVETSHILQEMDKVKAEMSVIEETVMAHYWLRRTSEEQKSPIKSPRRSSSADRELESPKLEETERQRSTTIDESFVITKDSRSRSMDVKIPKLHIKTMRTSSGNSLLSLPKSPRAYLLSPGSPSSPRSNSPIFLDNVVEVINPIGPWGDRLKKNNKKNNSNNIISNNTGNNSSNATLPRPTSNTTNSSVKTIRKVRKVHRLVHPDEEERLEKAQLVLRQKIAEELLQTEKSYVQSLKMVEFFRKNLINTKILNESDCFSVFSNINDLYNYHQQFLSILLQESNHWANSVSIGDLFLKNFCFVEKYETYIHIQNYGLATIYYLSKKNPIFSEAVNQFDSDQKRTTQLNLEAYLIMPVQRVPRYILLLQDMLKYTKESHPDYLTIPRVLDYFKSNMIKINSTMTNELQNAKKMIQIESLLEGPFESFVHPKRKFVREGILHLKLPEEKDGKNSRFGGRFKKKKGSSYYWFLFEDILIHCDPKKNPKDEKPYEYIETIPLKVITKILAEAGQLSHSKETFSFNLLVDNELWVLSAQNDVERIQWMKDFSRLISQYNKKPE